MTAEIGAGLPAFGLLQCARCGSWEDAIAGGG